MTDPSLRIVKDLVPVRLTVEGGAVLQGEVFLLPVAGRDRRGRERVIDRLGEAEPFLPLKTAEGTLLLRRDRIVLARVPGARDAGLADWAGDQPPDGVNEVDVLVDLARSAGLAEPQIRGRVRLSSLPEAGRLVDQLNDQSRFIALIDDEGALLVAKHHVLSVREQKAP